jgi:hypothetical protein
MTGVVGLPPERAAGHPRDRAGGERDLLDDAPGGVAGVLDGVSDLRAESSRVSRASSAKALA